MSLRADSVYSGRTDLCTNSDVELPHLSPVTLSNSWKIPDVEARTLLDTANTAYQPSHPPQHRSHTSGASLIEEELFPRWHKTWNYITLRPHSGSSSDIPINGKSTHRGWRKAVVLAAVATAVVLLTNTIFTIVVVVKYGSENGLGTIYTGSCNKVKRWNTGIHLVINVLGTVLLGASSYTMQCLNSPTRSQVDAAHAKRISLDIGLPSAKNFRYMPTWRFVVWFGLCLSTVPLHLLWNSTILTTSGANLFAYVVADESFLSGASYEQPSSYTTPNVNLSRYCSGTAINISDPQVLIPSIYEGYKANNYTELSAAQCFSAYVDGDGSSRRNLIMITTPTAQMNMSYCGFEARPWNGSSVVAFDRGLVTDQGWAFSHTNVDEGRYNGGPFRNAKDYKNAEDGLRQQIREHGTWDFGPYTIERCYSETTDVTRCRLQFVTYILYIVIVCNLIKLVCMCAAVRYLWDLGEPILATVGDATASFLENRDQTTTGFCLMGYRSLKGYRFWQDPTKADKYNPVYLRKTRTLLLNATSKTRWWVTILICTVYLSVGFILFSVSLSSHTDAMENKFGAVDASQLFGPRGDSSSALLKSILLANSFQLVLSTTYFLYNSLYTAQCAALEWASYVQGKLHSLRVTFPRGQQRSTYYLQLPYIYGIPLIIFLMLMHFLISQSVFLARLQFYDNQGLIVSTLGYMSVGFSSPAILTSCCVGAALIIAQIINALRPLDNRIPLHGNNSAVISAMCHPQPEKPFVFKHEAGIQENEKENIAEQKVMWGVTTNPEPKFQSHAEESTIDRYSAGHCSFTSRVVPPPEHSMPYR